MIRIGILYGGRSGEHDVSLCSAASVVAALDRNKYEPVAIGIDRDGRWYVQDEPVIIAHPDFGRVMQLKRTGSWRVNHYEQNGKLIIEDTGAGKSISVDLVWPALHGTFCEDGTLQGLLELAMVPYVGADVLGSAVGMDKDVAKRLLRDSGIPVVPWITVGRTRWEREPGAVGDEASRELGFPLFIKPVAAGSSVGVVKVKTRAEFPAAMDFALQYDTRVLIEKMIEAREIECSVLGNEEPRASVLGEITPHHEFYSYEAKYIDKQGADMAIPARLDPALAERIRNEAVRGYRSLCCAGMARVDFFLDRKSDAYYLNEINTLPGFTSISMYPKLWEATGLPYADLIDRLIDLAMERSAARRQIRTEL